ncbi:hypothetical protein YC2023_059745 [Brassica napus]
MSLSNPQQDNVKDCRESGWSLPSDSPFVDGKQNSYPMKYPAVSTENAKSVQENENHDRRQSKEATREDDICHKRIKRRPAKHQ